MQAPPAKAPVAMEVTTSFRRRALTGVIAGGALLLAAAVEAVLSTHPANGPPIVRYALVGLGLVFCCIPLALLVERGRTVRRFDLRGVTLHDGRFFEWARLRGVRPLTELYRSQARSVQVGVALDFDGGGRGVLNRRYVTNWTDLAPLLSALQHWDPEKVQRLLAAHAAR